MFSRSPKKESSQGHRRPVSHPVVAAFAGLLCATAVLAACEPDTADQRVREGDRQPGFQIGSRYDMTVISRGRRYTHVDFAVEVGNTGTATGTPKLTCTTILRRLHYALDMKTEAIPPGETALLPGSTILPGDVTDAELDDLRPRCRVEAG